MILFRSPPLDSTPYAVPKPASALPSWFTKKKIYHIWADKRNPDGPFRANMKWLAPATLPRMRTIPSTLSTTHITSNSELATMFMYNMTTQNDITFQDEDIYLRDSTDSVAWKPTWNDSDTEEPGRIFLHFLTMKGSCRFNSTLKAFLQCEAPVVCRHLLWLFLFLILLFVARVRMSFIKGPVTMRGSMRVCVFVCASMMALAMVAQVQLHREMVREVPVIKIHPADNGEIVLYMGRLTRDLKRMSSILVYPYHGSASNVGSIARKTHHFIEKLVAANEDIATSYLSPKETFHINSPFMNVFLKYEWMHFLVFMMYWPLVMLVVSGLAAKKKFLAATIMGAVFLCAAAVALTCQALLLADCCHHPEPFINSIAKQHKIPSEQAHFRDEYNRACGAWFAKFEIKLEYFEKQYLYVSKELRQMARLSFGSDLYRYASDLAMRVRQVTITEVTRIRQSLPPRCQFHFSLRVDPGTYTTIYTSSTNPMPTRKKLDSDENSREEQFKRHLTATEEQAVEGLSVKRLPRSEELPEPPEADVGLSVEVIPLPDEVFPLKDLKRITTTSTPSTIKTRPSPTVRPNYDRDAVGPIYMPPADAVMRTLCRRDRKLFWMLVQIIIMLTAAALMIMVVLLGIFTMHSIAKPPPLDPCEIVQPKVPCFYELTTQGFHTEQNRSNSEKRSRYTHRRKAKRFRTKKPFSLLHPRHASPKRNTKRYRSYSLLKRNKTNKSFSERKRSPPFQPYRESLRKKQVFSPTSCSNFPSDTYLQWKNKKKDGPIKRDSQRTPQTTRERTVRTKRVSSSHAIRNTITQTKKCSLHPILSVIKTVRTDDTSSSRFSLSDISMQRASMDFQHDTRRHPNTYLQAPHHMAPQHFGNLKNAVCQTNYNMWPPSSHKQSKEFLKSSSETKRYRNEGLSKYLSYLGRKRKYLSRKHIRECLSRPFKAPQKSVRTQKCSKSSMSYQSVYYDSCSITMSCRSNVSLHTLETQCVRTNARHMSKSRHHTKQSALPFWSTQPRKTSSECCRRSRNDARRHIEFQSKKTWSELSQKYMKSKSMNTNEVAAIKPIYRSKQAQNWQYKNVRTGSLPNRRSGPIRIKDRDYPVSKMKSACTQTRTPVRNIPRYESERPSLRTTRFQTGEPKPKKRVRKIYLKYYPPLHETKKGIGRHGTDSLDVYRHRVTMSEAGSARAFSYGSSTD